MIEQEKEESGNESGQQENESRCGRGNEEGNDDVQRRKCDSYVTAESITNYLDEGFSNNFNYDIRDFDLSLLEGENFRGEEDSTYIDGIPNICQKDSNQPEERIKQVFTKELSEHIVKQRVVHDVFGTKYNHTNLNLDNGKICRKFGGAVLIIAYHGTTSTSSMIVHTPITHVDVHSSNVSKTRSLEYSLFDELFQVGNTRSNIGQISQSICRRTAGLSSTLTSPVERGFKVVKLDVFGFNKIFKKPKTEWWNEANYRSTFIIQSPLDLNYQLVMKLLVAATNNINKISSVKKKRKGRQSNRFP